MRFTFGDAEYKLSFRRFNRRVVTGATEGGELRYADSKYPYTEVTLTRKGLDGKEVPIRKDVAGAYFKERFTLEQGRLAALRKISITLDKELKKAMWEAYTRRSRG